MTKNFIISTKVLYSIVFAAAMFFCSVSNAQYESFVVRDKSATSPVNTLVRYIDDTLAVGYFDDDVNGYFVLVNLNSATITHKVKIQHQNMYVRDLRILGDTVYACGTHLVPNVWKGFIMKFNINLIRTGSGSKDNASYYDIDSTSELSRMVVFHNDLLNLNEVVAIGHKVEHVGNYNKKHGRIVDYKSSGSFNVGKDYSNADTIEFIDDIVLTQNHIGFIGSLGSRKISLRKACRGCTDMFSSMIDTLCYYSISDNEPASMIHATATRGDSIAAAAYAVTSSGAFVTRIRQYRLNNLDLFDAKEFSMTEKVEPCELAYNRLSMTYLMLEYLPYEGSLTHDEYQVVTQRVAGTNSVESYFVPGKIMSSIASSPNDVSFMLAGGSTFAFKHYWGAPSRSCFDKASISYMPRIVGRERRGNFPIESSEIYISAQYVGLETSTLDSERMCRRNLFIKE